MPAGTTTLGHVLCAPRSRPIIPRQRPVIPRSRPVCSEVASRIFLGHVLYVPRSRPVCSYGLTCPHAPVPAYARATRCPVLS
eukprot:1274579-Rhodomonas_salina.2